MSFDDPQRKPALVMNSLLVTIATQKVELLDSAGEILWQAPVSTSRWGCGEEPGSHKTPRGRFRIGETIGAGEPICAIFKSRQPTGEIWDPGQPPVDDDLILTRILWLDGDKPSNANTRERYIYFHGTNHENQIGTPASHGCIRLRNTDMLALFDLAFLSMSVIIKEHK